MGINPNLSPAEISVAKFKNSLNLQNGEFAKVTFYNPDTQKKYIRIFQVRVVEKSKPSDAEFFVSDEVFKEWGVSNPLIRGIFPVSVKRP